MLVLGGEARSSQRHAVAPLPAFLALPVPDAVLLVHHLLQQRLVICVQRSHGNVPHRSELTTVVQVLVLQTEEVPHEASGDDGKEEGYVALTYVCVMFPLWMYNHRTMSSASHLKTSSGARTVATMSDIKECGISTPNERGMVQAKRRMTSSNMAP